MDRQGIFDTVRKIMRRPNYSDEDLTLYCDLLEGQIRVPFLEHPRSFRSYQWTIPTQDDQGVPFEEDTPLVPLPSDCGNLVKLWSDSVAKYEQYPLSINPECGYHDRGLYVHLFPTPIRGSVIYLDYNAFLRKLQSSVDVNWVSEYFAPVYVYGLLSLACSVEEHPQVTQWEQNYRNAVLEVRRQGALQNLDPNRSVQNG